MQQVIATYAAAADKNGVGAEIRHVRVPISRPSRLSD